MPDPGLEEFFLAQEFTTDGCLIEPEPDPEAHQTAPVSAEQCPAPCVGSRGGSPENEEK